MKEEDCFKTMETDPAFFLAKTIHRANDPEGKKRELIRLAVEEFSNECDCGGVAANTTHQTWCTLRGRAEAFAACLDQMVEELNKADEAVALYKQKMHK